MRVTTLLLTLIPLALASPILEISEELAVGDVVLEKRADNAATVLKDLTTLSKDTTALNTTLNSFADDAAVIPTATLIKLNDQTNAIITVLKNTAKSANASTDFTDAQSKSITAKVKGQETPTFSTLDNVVAHKKAFANSGVTSTIVSSLQQQMELVRELGSSLTAKESATYKKMAAPIEKAFASHFSAAIKALG